MRFVSKDFLKVIGILLIITSVLGCITGTENDAQNNVIDDRMTSSEMSPPVNVEFFFSENPELNKEVNLTLKATSVVGVYEHVELGINLPSGFKLVSGKPRWNGVLEPYKTQSISVTVKAINEGRWEPEGTVYGEGLYFSPHLYVYIKDDVVKVSNIPPTNNWKNKVGFSGSRNDEDLTSNISLSEPPVLDREVILSYVVNTTVQLNNAQVSVVFPEKGMEMVKITSATIEQAGHVNKIDLELIEGTQQYNWRGFIRGNSTVRAEMIVKSTLTGGGFVHATIRGNESIFQTVVLEIKVDEFSASYNARKR